MAADHEDYETGAAPAAHKVSHQDGGTDEISVAGLAGITNELAAHALIATAHQDAPGLIAAHALIAAAHHARYTDLEAEAIADAQIAIHALVVDAHHARYTDVEARASINNIFGSDGKADSDIDLDTHKLINVVNPVGDQDADTKIAREANISVHALISTAHQDAPALIETHRLVAGAHHAKYTDANARASIGNIFGADGKADADIDLDTHKIGVEGTWTPTKGGWTEAGGGSYTLTGYYIKIGTLVWIHAMINCIGGATIASLGGTTSWLGNLPYNGSGVYQAVLGVLNPWTITGYGQAILTADKIYPDVFGPTPAGQGVLFQGSYRV